MKPSDRLLPDGRLRSEALGRVKAAQHERRTVIQWTGEHWVVVRLPLMRPQVDAAPPDS
jgi:hypothetical protein